MAIIPAKFTLDNRVFSDSSRKARFLNHKFSYPYESDYAQLVDQGLCLPGIPGYVFLSAEDIDEGDNSYPFNLLVPDTYGDVVLYRGLNTPDLSVGDILLLGVEAFEVQVNLPQGSIIRLSNLKDVTNQIFKGNREADTVYAPDIGIYIISSKLFCSAVNPGEGGIIPAKLSYRYTEETTYESLPLGTYFLDDQEDRDIIIVFSQTEAEEILAYLPDQQRLYNSQTGEYYTIDKTNLELQLDQSRQGLISPSRWLLKGFDAGLDYVRSSGERIFNERLNPDTAEIQNLPFLAQSLGLNALASAGEIYQEDYIGDTPGQNPIRDQEYRTLLKNALGWCRPIPDGSPFSGTVSIVENNIPVKIDFTFNGSNNFSYIEPGDRGIHLEGNPTVYTAIEPTDETQITLQNETDPLDTLTVPNGTRIYGVIYNKQSNLSIKGLAMSSFADNLPDEIPGSALQPLLNFSDPAKVYDFIALENWQQDFRGTVLVPGYTYHLYLLDTNTANFLTDITPGNYPETYIESVNVIDSENLTFTLKDSSHFENVNGLYEWIELGLKFTTQEIKERYTPSIELDPDNWLGIIGSKGSDYGQIVANTIIGVSNPIPDRAEDYLSVVRVDDIRTLAKSKLIEKLVGAKHFTSYTQYSDLVAGVSETGDYYFEENTLRYAVLDLTEPYRFPYFYHETSDSILQLKQDGELKINGQDTGIIFPGATIDPLTGGGDENKFGNEEKTGQILRLNIPTQTLYATKFGISPYESFVWYDSRIIQLNKSHGYYLKLTGNTTYPVVLKKSKLEVRKLTMNPDNLLLFQEYPWLRVYLPSLGFYKYLDLLTGFYFYCGSALSHTTQNGKVLHDGVSNLIYTPTLSREHLYSTIEVSNPGAVLALEEEYLGQTRQDVRDGQNALYKYYNGSNFYYIVSEDLLNLEPDFLDPVPNTFTIFVNPILGLPEREIINQPENGEIRFYY